MQPFYLYADLPAGIALREKLCNFVVGYIKHQSGRRENNVANTKAPVITISASGANAGYVNLWGVPVWSADSSYIDSSVTPHIYFWYNLLKFNQKNIFDSQTGSAQPHICPKHIGDIHIPDLDLNKVADYNKIVTPIYEQITNTQKLNMQLTVTRDTLLPKLMSGEIKI